MKERSIVWQAGEENPRLVTMADLPELVESGVILWYDLSAPSPDDIAHLGDLLHLDPHTLEDALAPHERPKITHLDSYSFMTSYFMSVHTGHRLKPCRISAFILDHCLITIHSDDLVLDEVTTRWRQAPQLVAWGGKGLFQGLMDVMVDAQFDILEKLDDAIDDLSRQLFTEKPDIRTVQQQTFHLRGRLVILHRVIPQTRDIVAAVLRQSLAEGWPAELRVYWEDINDHVLRATEWVDSLRDLVTSIFEASLALNDSRMNEVMKKLASWAAIIAVPTLITGWYGMNVPYPGFSATTGLIAVICLIVISVTSLFVIFKHNNWL